MGWGLRAGVFVRTHWLGVIAVFFSFLALGLSMRPALSSAAKQAIIASTLRGGCLPNSRYTMNLLAPSTGQYRFLVQWTPSESSVNLLGSLKIMDSSKISQQFHHLFESDWEEILPHLRTAIDDARLVASSFGARPPEVSVHVELLAVYPVDKRILSFRQAGTPAASVLVVPGPQLDSTISWDKPEFSIDDFPAGLGQ